MAPINTGKLVIGAIAAGVVINIVESIVNLFIIADQMEAMLASRNLPEMGNTAMAGFTLLAFMLGALVVWTYAAIRPRYGEGAITALKAGFAVWAAFYFLGTFTNWLMGFVGTDLFIITLAYTLPMMLAAGYVGGYLYREEPLGD